MSSLLRAPTAATTRFLSPHRSRSVIANSSKTGFIRSKSMPRFENLPKRSATQLAAEPFMTGTSSVYIEEMYHAWLENPASVHKVHDENPLMQNNLGKKKSQADK